MTQDGLDEAFHSADPDVRRRAVQGMSLRPRGTPLKQIVDALSDSDWRVRREAISLAAQSAERDALVDSLLARLVETDNIGLRNAAVEVLGMVAQGKAHKFANALDGAGGGAQKFVVEAMGKTRDPGMIDHLEPLVRGSDGNVAAAAVEALVCIGGSRAEGLLKERLSTPHLFLRISILEGLTRLGTRLTWSELGPAVDDAIVRRISAELLGRTGDPEALEFLLDLATDPSPQTSSAALRAIAVLASEIHGDRDDLVDRLSASNDSFRQALHEALLHGDTPTRQGAAYLAVLCRDPSSLEAVLQAVADDVVSPETIAALRTSGSELIEPLLMQRGSEPRVWAIALELAAELSYRHLEEVPAAIRDRIRSLIERDLTDAADAVRAAAAESLLWWGDPRDCRALVECLSSPSHQVRAAATSALEGLAKRVPEAVEEALREADLDGPGGADIAHVLSRLNSAGAEELLKRGLHSGDARTRRAAVQALAIANASDMAQLIGYAVADEDIDVQIAAVRTLGQMSTGEADGPLGTALESRFAPTRAEAALALGRRESNGSIPRIRALLEDKEPVVVSAALDALAWLGDSEVARAVERALSHADDEIFQAGLRAARTLPVHDAERFVSRGLTHSAWNVRMLAIKLLLDLDTDRTRLVLRRALTNETDSMVRHAIESGLRLGA
ncbi:MAG: HEAT repeat domain-containing protein [Deltaproteobacteria bacterium]|nr:HEAT repeat domain-containing protein [Deltaproteobacteria bacterium]